MGLTTERTMPPGVAVDAVGISRTVSGGRVVLAARATHHDVAVVHSLVDALRSVEREAVGRRRQTVPLGVFRIGPVSVAT